MRKGRFIFVVIFILILGLSNSYLFFNKGRFSYSSFSGMSIKELPKLPLNVNLSILLFVAQWALLLLIIIITYLRYLKHMKDEDVKISYKEVKNKKGKFETDLDVLYDILKKKKKLKISTISKAFKIKKEKALEWIKILENQELAVVEYPAFREPEVRINEKEEKVEKEGEEKGRKK